MGKLSEKKYDMQIYKGVYTINDDKKRTSAKVNMT